jgi:plastocyanin
MSMQIRAHALLATLLLAACGGDGGGGTSEVVEIIKWTPSGDNQTGLAGTTLPLALRVKVTVNDQNAEGRTVTWTGPGVFGSPSSVTNVNGVATTTWTMPDGTGPVSATATLAGAVGSPITFHATSTADVPATLLKISGDGQAAEVLQFFAAPFQVQVADQFGNGVDSVMVVWSIDGPVTLIQDSVITTQGGFASGFLQARDSVATVTLTATVVGLAGSPVNFTANIVGPPVVVEVHSNFFDPATANISVGQAVKWVWVNSGHTVSTTSGAPIGNSPIKDAGGSYGPVVFNSPGTYSYECSVHLGMTGQVVVTP